jgi:hypothetical protein
VDDIRRDYPLAQPRGHVSACSSHTCHGELLFLAGRRMENRWYSAQIGKANLGDLRAFPRGAAWFQELLSKNSDLLDPVWSAMARE